jgi:hypothetical protein
MNRQLQLSKGLGLSPAFVEAFMNAIHQESIRRQSSVLSGTGEGVSGSQG